MPIYYKDGKQFKLNGINPLMKNQEHWDHWNAYFPEVEEIVLLDPKRKFAVQVDEDTPTFVPSIAGVGPIEQKEIIYLLPLLVSYEEDPLYGTKKRMEKWGEKFSFEAVTIEATGLSATFFANVPLEKVPQGSIVYVYKERTWWKATNVEAADEGIAIYCMPSDVKPSFM